MRALLDRLFRESPEDPFLTLMSLAAEDTAIRDRLLSALDQPPAQRQRTIHSWHTSLEKAGAPRSLTSAIGFLRDEATARRALELLSDVH